VYEQSLLEKNIMKRETIALEMKREILAISPFIQKHTSLVCPMCEKVCCVNIHGSYDRDDVVFISALGIRTSADSSDREDSDPCRHLEAGGCSLERWKRPFRCTWYFCESLLESMNNDRGKVYRKFITSFQRIMSIRQRLLNCQDIQ
jgi:hypothetical protein